MNQKAIRRQGFDVKIFDQEDAKLTDCDALLIDSRYFNGSVRGQADYIVSRMSRWAEKLTTIAWCDTTDSAGRLYPQVLEYVSLYLKNQILNDRTNYMRPMYGRRLFTDFYHRENKVADDEFEEPLDREPQILRSDDLRKIAVSWNSALADYSFIGPYRAACHRHVPFGSFGLRYPTSFGSPRSLRDQDVSCRLSTVYDRKSVAFQRKAVLNLLGDHVPKERISRRMFFRELQSSKVVVSPFGWGEINYRDYEAFLSGAMLLKPDMSHLQTWPNLFVEGQTIGCFSWNLTDAKERLESLLSRSDERLRIATEGQLRYRQSIEGPQSKADFVSRFSRILCALEHGVADEIDDSAVH